MQNKKLQTKTKKLQLQKSKFTYIIACLTLLIGIFTLSTLLFPSPKIPSVSANGYTLKYSYLSETDSYSVSGFTGTPVEVTTISSTYDDGINGSKPVTTIGYSAFSGCSSLTSITIPDSITSIGGSAFSGCTKLTSINVSSNNANYSSLSGILFNRDQTALICYPEGKTATTYTIPDSVTTIGERAFYNCASLTTVIFETGSQLTTIGGSAFYYFSGLTSITIPSSVTSIGDNAFDSCTSLRTVTFEAESQLTSIGEYAFSWCRSLTTVSFETGSQLISIGTWAFSRCPSLTSITIPDSVTSIGDYAFRDCTSLTSIIIPDSVTSIGIFAFDSTAWLNSQEDGVVYAGSFAYTWKGDMSEYTSIELISGTKGIAGGAFYACISLTSITIPNSVTIIGDKAFQSCRSLTSIIIPSSVTSIGKLTFSSCSSLTSITIPDSVTTIGGSAFSDCSSLATMLIQSPTPPTLSSTNTISSATTKIYVPRESVEDYKSAENWSTYANIIFSQTVEVVFQDHDGSVIQEFTIEYGGSVTPPNDPTRIGYRFTGWDVPFDNVTKDITIRATYEVKQYTMTFETNGGSTVEDITQNFNTEVLAPDNPTRTGYLFDGWFTDNNTFENVFTFPILMPASGKTLYAKWTPITYTVTFDPSGGMGEMDEQVLTYDLQANLSENAFEKEGYSFAGWLWNSTNYADTAAVLNLTSTSDETLTLVAQWTANKYIVTFDYQGADGNNTILDKEVTFDSTYETLPTPTRTGYLFTGWFTDPVDGSKKITNNSTVLTASNHTLYAHWTTQSFEVTFVDWDGTELSTQQVAYEGAATAPETPERAGYKFENWDQDFSSVDEDITIMAVYSPVEYTIAYDLNGGNLEEENPKTYTIEEEFTLINPVKEGYRFDGWTETDLDEPTKIITIQEGSVGNKVYTANWQTIEYGISYEFNGGNLEEENPETYTIEDEFTLNNPVKEGYIFLGWTGADLEEPTMTVTISEGSMGNKTYTANWQAIEYGISYELNGGSLEEGNPETYTIEDEFTLNNPVKEGYIFLGWTGTDLDEPTEVVTISRGNTETRSYTANWQIITFTVEFYGKNEELLSEQTVDYGSSAVAPTLPNYAGFDFVSWDAPFSNVTSDLSINSEFTIIVYSITYNLDNGIVEDTNPLNYTVESQTFTLSNPTKVGYIFLGWTETDLDEPTKIITIQEGSIGNKVYTAKWTPITYTVIFDPSGGMGEMDEQVLTYDLQANLSANTFEKEGYSFAGWLWNSINYADNKAVLNLTSTSDETLTLVAQWTANKYIVTFDYQGADGNNTILDKEVTFGSTYETLPTPTRTGYLFTGWFTDPVDGSEKTKNYTVLTASDHTLYARWTTQSFEVTFVDWDGTELSTQQVAYGKAAVPPESPERAGYKFENWDKGFSSINEDITIMAVYSPVEYTIAYNLSDGNNHTDNPLTYTIESQTFTLSNPTRIGYTFIGWTGTDIEEPTMIVEISERSSGDRTYIANWQAIEYGISYDLNGGGLEEENPETYTIEDEFTLNNPVKEGYIFLGWTGTGLSGLTKNVTITAGNTEARSYTANWSAVEYTIAYNLDGGIFESGEDNPLTYTIESQTFTLNNPVRIGYIFLGWTETDLDEPTKIITIQEGSIGNKVYTANWQTIEYGISYDLNGGSLEEGNPATYTIEDEFTLINPVKEGYRFDGWTGTDLDEPTEVVTISRGNTETRSYTANWQIKTFTVTFYDFDGETLDTQIVDFGNDATAPSIPTVYGYYFESWDTSFTYVKEDIIIMAVYSPVEYTIAYNLNGGEVEGNNPLTYTIESQTFTLSNPTRIGYTFISWTGTDLDEPTMTVTISEGSSGDRTYIANWQIITFTVEFYGKNEELLSEQTVDYGSSAVAPTLPNYAGFDFVSWDAPFNNVTSDLSINSEFTIIVYSITYNLDNGIVEDTNPLNYTVESQTFTLNNPTKEGYIFLGWTGTDLDETEKTVTIQEGSVGNKVYTANWEIITYIVEFIDYNGAIIEAKEVAYGNKIIEPDEPVMTNRKFIGWFTDAEWTTPFDFDAVHNKDVVVYAKSDAIISLTITEDESGEITQSVSLTIKKEFEELSLLKAQLKDRKLGHTLTGWIYKNLTTNKVVVIDSETVFDYSAGVSIQGIYVPNTYQISFDLFYPTSTQKIDPITLSFGDAITSLPSPTRDGYSFSGWYIGDEKVEVGDVYNLASNVTLRAVWETKPFNFIWIAVGGGIILLVGAIITIYLIQRKRKLKSLSIGKNLYKY